MRAVQHPATLVTIATVTIAAIALPAGADTSPQDASDYRKSVMTSLRGHIGASSMHVRGLVDGPEFLVKHAEGLANGVSELATLFPDGSAVEDSDALPAIWERPEEFAAAIDKAVAATQKFVAAAQSGDAEAISGAFREVGGSCRGCHDNFRVPQD